MELDGRLFHDTTEQRDRDFDRDLDVAADGSSTLRLLLRPGVRPVVLDGVTGGPGPPPARLVGDAAAVRRRLYRGAVGGA